MKLFLSYASERRTLADEIQLAVTGAGHDVFFDRANLRVGGDFNAAIRDELATCDGLIFLICPVSIAAGAYTLTELKFAKERWRHPAGHVLPAMADPTPMASIDPYLRAVHILIPDGYLPAEIAAESNKMWGQEVDVVRTISLVGRELAAGSDQLAASRKQEVADYLNKIRDCLADVHEKLESNQVPHGSCGALAGYADELEDTVGDYLGEGKAKTLAGLLAGAYNVESLILTFRDDLDRSQQLGELAGTVGRLQAIVDSVRART